MLFASSSAVLDAFNLTSVTTLQTFSVLQTFNEKATWAAQSCCNTDIRKQQGSMLRLLILTDIRAHTN